MNKVVSEVETRKILTKDETMADKVDKVLTNKVAGILIFAVVMYGVFWISPDGPGTADRRLAGRLHRNVPGMGCRSPRRGRSKRIPPGAAGGWYSWRCRGQ